jgi:hypothetical protein
MLDARAMNASETFIYPNGSGFGPLEIAVCDKGKRRKPLRFSP